MSLVPTSANFQTICHPIVNVCNAVGLSHFCSCNKENFHNTEYTNFNL